MKEIIRIKSFSEGFKVSRKDIIEFSQWIKSGNITPRLREKFKSDSEYEDYMTKYQESHKDKIFSSNGWDYKLYITIESEDEKRKYLFISKKAYDLDKPVEENDYFEASKVFNGVAQRLVASSWGSEKRYDAYVNFKKSKGYQVREIPESVMYDEGKLNKFLRSSLPKDMTEYLD